MSKWNGTTIANGDVLAWNAAAGRFEVLSGVSGDPAAVAVAGTSVDWSAGKVFTKTIAANTTFTFSNATSGRSIMVRVTAGAGNTVTWPTVKWAGGVAPTQTSGGTDMYSFIHDGTNIYGSVVQAMS